MEIKRPSIEKLANALCVFVYEETGDEITDEMADEIAEEILKFITNKWGE